MHARRDGLGHSRGGGGGGVDGGRGGGRNSSDDYSDFTAPNNNDWMTHQPHSVSGASPGWDSSHTPYTSRYPQHQPLAQWMEDRQRAFAEFSQSLQPTKSAADFFDTSTPSLFWNSRPSLVSNR